MASIASSGPRALPPSDCLTPDWSEAERLTALERYEILDTGREPAFDNLVALAAYILDAPIAVINFIAGDRQWFKAEIGIDRDELPLDVSICRFAILQPGLFVVEDLAADPRFENNPLVAIEDGLRFYAGVLLETPDGLPLGTVCVLDSIPRPGGIAPQQAKALRALAQQVMSQLELRRAAALANELARHQQALLRIGEQVRNSDDIAAMIVATAQTVGLTMAVDRVVYATLDAPTAMLTVHPGWSATGTADLSGAHRLAELWPAAADPAAGAPLAVADAARDARTAADAAALQAAGIGAFVDMPVRDHAGGVAMLVVHAAAARDWTEGELAFLRSVTDRLEAGIGRLRAEAQQQVLNIEISHRLKNMLAMVQAIAGQTLRQVAERAPVETFERRLLALSSAHDVLMQSSWASAGLAEVIEAVLEPLGFGHRILRSGPPVQLGQRAALSCSLLMHELTTNAIKYGALSTASGHVDIGWSVARDGAEATLTLQWRERGGPPATAPTRRGFGSRLISLGLVGTGGVVLRYLPVGLEADLTATLERLALS